MLQIQKEQSAFKRNELIGFYNIVEPRMSHEKLSSYARRPEIY